MRNGKVFILLISRDEPTVHGEEGRSALGLYAKYNGRVVDGVTQAVELLNCHGKKLRTVDAALKEAKDRKIALADGDKVGFYLVGHLQSYDTNKPVKLMLELLKERVAAAPKVEDASSGKKKQRAIEVSIDKVCLVLCASADRATSTGVAKTKDDPLVVKKEGEAKKDYTKRLQADVKQYGLETSMLADVCRRLAEEGHRPRVAGYVGAITAVGPTDVDGTGFTSASSGFKDKLKVGQKTANYDDTGKKLFYVYEPDRGYMEQDRATWTDKR